ncbi:MAG: glycosyltransferase [Clostridia bacterium]|nr:glycosyltransferase [Clostridia bacterium]
MKILLASDSYCFTTSGVSNVVIALAEGLRRRGYEVKVLTLAKGRASGKEGDDYYIRSLPSLIQPEIRISLARTDPLLDELVAWKPDLIHLHTEASIERMARYIADRTGAPIIMTSHTDYAYYAFRRFHTARPVCAAMKVIGKKVYGCAEIITAPSEKARRFPLLQAEADRVVLVPNGIKLEQYQKPVSPEEKAALFERYGLTDNGYTLVMITRVSREKNIMEILRFLPALIRELPDIQLVIVGDGPDRKRLEQFTVNNGLTDHVRFTGMIPSGEVYRYYAMGDVFVSASQFEVHSLSYLEAMAGGLPLVCRDDPCLLGVLEEGKNGFSYRTETEFIQAVRRITCDSGLKQRMREYTLEKVKSFSDQCFVDHMIEQYELLLSGRQNEPTGTGTV